MPRPYGAGIFLFAPQLQWNHVFFSNVEILDGRLKEAIDHIYLGAIKRFSGIKPVKTRRLY